MTNTNADAVTRTKTDIPGGRSTTLRANLSDRSPMPVISRLG